MNRKIEIRFRFKSSKTSLCHNHIKLIILLDTTREYAIEINNAAIILVLIDSTKKTAKINLIQ